MAEEPSRSLTSSVQFQQQFHSVHGSLVQLSENGLSAFRLRPSHEFNQGLVFSSRSLKDEQVFEVRIDRKVHSWTGSLQIGITTQDPSSFHTAPPPNALDIVNKSWILSGCNLFENGKIVVEDYGPNLDELNEGDRVGVLRTTEGDLVFYVNSFAQGVAVSSIPKTIFAVVDLYGKCVQVSMINRTEAFLPTRPLLTLNSTVMDSNQEEESCSTVSTPSVALQDRLRFHHRCGTMVKLSAGQRTGERRRPLDEFNNGVVMTQRPLLPDELFEIRIDSLVDKWSGSIEVGITTHNPAALDFPSTMTNLRSGTIMMSGCGILTNGKGTRREYGQSNLDELGEGDRIGLIRKSNGDLHFYVNGRDQGIAASNVPHPVWGVVDLYGRTVRVSLIDREDVVSKAPKNDSEEEVPAVNQLRFHSRCGSHAEVINNGNTGHRPNAQSDFNHGVLLTNRPLKPDELFEVVLDKVVLKWAGSIEIGVTTQHPDELDFPATMTNVRSGTWMMTGNGVMHNGLTVLDDYGTSLDRLGAGDRVGVVRRSDGVLHFLVNGEDQGPAAGHIPEIVYGVIDLYGQAAQVSIVTPSPATPLTDSSPYLSYIFPAPSHLQAPLVSPSSLADSTYALPISSSSVSAASSTLIHTDLSFHRLHGRNTTLSSNGLTASRPSALSEFNDAICITSRPLKAGEMFEVVIEKLVERWSGSLELGVSSIRPENLDFPSTMTDITYGTWMLSGSSVMQDGTITRNSYPLDLDTLQEGNRVGLLRHADGTLHYYLNDQDQGAACWNVPQDVYAVIDLYGQCAQVSLVHKPLQSAGLPLELQEEATPLEFANTDFTSGSHTFRHHHRLSPFCGRAITITEDGRVAKREDKDFENGLVFSLSPLLADESFDFRIDSISQRWAGSIAVGLTTFHPQEGVTIPSRLDFLESAWYVSGSRVIQPNNKILASCLPLEHLAVGDIVSIRRTADSALRLAVNSRDLNVCVNSIPHGAYVVIDLHGMIHSISVKSVGKTYSLPESTATTPAAVAANPPPTNTNGILPLSLSQLALREAMQGIQSALSSRFGNAFNHQQRFHENHGRNIILKNNGQTAVRSASYNQGLVYSKEPLLPGGCFQVKIEQIDERWTGSLMLGVTGIPLDKLQSSTPPTCALLLKKPSFIISGYTLHQGGRKVRSDLRFDLNQLQVGQSAGVHLTQTGHLHVLIDGVDCGSVAWIGTSEPFFVVVDLYGKATEVSTVSVRPGPTTTSTPTTQSALSEEKALRESSNTEKSVVGGKHSYRLCRYRLSCTRFVNLMGLPDVYLEKEGSLCGCLQCFSEQESTTTKLDEEMKGWCRWTVRGRRQIDKNDDPGINEKWQIAYHVTRPSVVRRIIDEGHLLPPDLNIWQRTRAARRSSKGNDGESNGQLLFSPSLQPTSLSPVAELYDPVSKKPQRGLVVLQVAVQPGSYKVKRATSPLSGSAPSQPTTITLGSVASNPDATQHLLNTPTDTTTVEDPAIVWYTKERGAAIVQALLVKLEDQ